MGLTLASLINPDAAGNALLDAVVDLLQPLADDPESGWAMPARVGYVPGAITAYDGEQLTLNWMDLQIGEPEADQNRPINPAELVFFYVFSFTMLRKVATQSGQGRQGGVPGTDRLATDATTIATDGSLLMQALVAIHAAGTIQPVNIPFQYGPVSTIGPEGALSGVRCQVRFQAGVNINGGY